MKKKDNQRLTVIVASHLHKHLKVMCAQKRISITSWLTEAIVEKLKKEQELGF